MGTKLGRLEMEFIIKSLSEKKIPLSIHSKKLKIDGLISDYSNEIITLEAIDSSWDGIDKEMEINIFLSYFKHVMTFKTIVLGTSERVLKIKHPEEIYKNLKRQYERVRPHNEIKISFKLESKNVELDFPMTGAEIEGAVNPPKEFDISSIGDLMEDFRGKTGKVATDSKIVMFRQRKPDTYAEEIVVRTGKVLFIPDSLSDFIENDDSGLPGRVITKQLLIEEGRERGIEPDLIEEKISFIMAEAAQKGIVSELYCPVLYHKYVIGYIHVYSTDKEKKITKDILDFITEFSKVLTYSLKMNGYFDNKGSKIQNYNARIIDISTSGVLFAHNSRELKTSLFIYTDIDIEFTIGHRKIIAGSQVMRKFNDKDMSYYGLQFMNVKPEDFRFLFDYIYGRKYTVLDGQLWEGGSLPPELKL